MEEEKQDPLDWEMRELMRRMRPVLEGLKRGPPPPAVFEEAFKRGSLGPRHAPVLIVVALEGEPSVSDVAERLGLSLSTTSLLVGELNRAGLLDRTEDENDRRRTLVRMNDRYDADARAWLEERLGPFRRTLERLSPAARANFLDGWRILEEETARTAPGAAAEDCGD